MNRIHFLIGSGILITAASFQQTFAFEGQAETQARPDPEAYSDVCLKAIAWGLHAPNPHNTQAWKFQIISEREFLFFADEHRLLTVTDPPARQIHIGCGCFLECMKEGMRSSGYESHIELFPEGKYEFKDIGKKAIARIRFQAGKNLAFPLASFIKTRRSSRLFYEEVKLSPIEINELLSHRQNEQNDIRFITQSEELEKLLPILYEGMEVETFTHKTHDESRKWFRQNDEIIAKQRDGINLPGNGTKGILKWLAERQLKDLDEKTWHNEKANQMFLKKHKEKVLSTKNLLLITSPENDPANWIECGRDYLRLSLAAYAKGYYFHPLSQVLQEFEEMNPLREKFEEVIKVEKPAKIQMAVRVGKSKAPYLSYRRFPKDLVL
ncbi:MAG: hypothetical protein AAFR87_02275 [Bacteroidota bacterium]